MLCDSMTFWASADWQRYAEATGHDPLLRLTMLRTAEWGTRIVDLTQPEDKLWADVRGSYHALINRLVRDPDFDVTIHTRSPFSDAVWRARDLHRLEAGGDTRSLASWETQETWMRKGIGIVALATRAGSDVGFAYVVRYGTWAYYFSAASVEPNVQHAIQWTLMRYLKRAGVQCYELGWQGEATDDKGKAIEFFRRGFGGVDYPTASVIYLGEAST